MSLNCVTGSQGFLGRHLMAALGPDAAGLDLPECDVLDWRYDPRDGCPLNIKTIGAETVWHLAALNDATQTFYDRPWDVLNTQIRGTLNVIGACVANGVKTLVLFSSSEVYQTPPVIPTPEDVPLIVPDLKNPRYSYGGGKIAAELLAWWSAIPRVIIIRPHNVYGPGQQVGHVIPDMIDRLESLEDGSTLTVNGRGSRSYCYVDDFIAGARKAVAAQHPEQCREVYHVGTEREVDATELAARIASLMGRKLSIEEWTGGAIGGTARRCPDTRKLRALGWAPQVDLAEGLAKTIAWHREQKK